MPQWEHGLEYIVFYAKTYGIFRGLLWSPAGSRQAARGARYWISFVGREVTLRQAITRTDDEFFHRAFYKLSMTFGKTFLANMSLFLQWYVAE